MAEQKLSSPDTHFAPAARDGAEEFARKVRVLKQVPLLSAVLDTIPGRVMVLNTNRQIVAANAVVLQSLGRDGDDLLQKRPGEAIGCIHSHEGPGGCGTDIHCAACGASQAVQESLERNRQAVRECRIRAATASGVAALDLKVTATPITVEGDRFVVVAIDDISQKKRLAVLQRVFFHDVLNTAGCIHGYAHRRTWGPARTEAPELIARLSQQLVEEIQAQRDLLAAESGDLVVHREPVQTAPLLGELQETYSNSAVATDRMVVLANVWDGTINTDRLLLRRVLGNMLKNALEATARGNRVSISCKDRGEKVQFAVWNAEAMPPDVQLQVFQRSFSTKGVPGRGVGTYSMQLLGERYLGGRVAFASIVPGGTTFTLTLAKH